MSDRLVERTYIGIHESVRVIELNDRLVEQGETIKVTSAFAARLDDQPDNWATPGQAKKSAAKKPRRASKKAQVQPPANADPADPVPPQDVPDPQPPAGDGDVAHDAGQEG